MASGNIRQLAKGCHLLSLEGREVWESNEKSSHRRMKCSFVSVLCFLLPPAREVLRYDPKTRTTSRFGSDLIDVPISFESKHPTYSEFFPAHLRLWALLPLLTEVGIHKCLS